jgi:hypothetical protein
MRMRASLPYAIALTGSLLSARAGAQPTPSTVAVGMRVRVSIASEILQSPFASRDERLLGTIHAISPDTLYLQLPNVIGVAAIPRRSIRRVEIGVGPSHRGNAVRAGILGASFFGLRLWAVNEDSTTRRFGHSWQAAAVGSAVGFGLGAWLGSKYKTERWRAARLPF